MKTKDIKVGESYYYLDGGPAASYHNGEGRVKVLATGVRRSVRGGVRRSVRGGYQTHDVFDGIEVMAEKIDPEALGMKGYRDNLNASGKRIVCPAEIIEPWTDEFVEQRLKNEALRRTQAVLREQSVAAEAQNAQELQTALDSFFADSGEHLTSRRADYGVVVRLSGEAAHRLSKVLKGVKA